MTATASAPPPCPPAEVVAAFADGSLDGTSLEEVRAHVAGCADCRAVIAAVSSTENPSTQADAGIDSRRFAELLAHARVGETIDGAWRLVRLLGAGGMGQVFEAVHVDTGKRVALKLLRPELALERALVQRFERERHAADRVSHPAFVSVIASGTTKDHAPYFVMNLVEGDDLRTIVERNGPLSEAAVRKVGLQLLEAVAAAHAAGVLHRDVKPANLAIDRDDKLWILDFGIARIIADAEISTGSGRTATGQMLGTPAFMPPEQARAIPSEIDERADLFAIAATLVFLLTGRSIRSSTGTLFEAMTQPVAPVDTLAPRLSPSLRDVLDRALAFDKADRFPSANAMRAALEDPNFVAGPRVHPRARRRRAIVVGACALAALVLGVGVGDALLASRSTPARQDPALSPPAPMASTPALTPEPPLATANVAPLASASAASTLSATARSPRPPPVRPSRPSDPLRKRN